MENRYTRVPNRVLFTALLLTGLTFLFAPPRLTDKFQHTFVRIFRWPLSIGRKISLSAYGLMETTYGSTEHSVSRERYERLHNHLANVSEWLRQERKKVEKLSGLRDRTVWKGVNFVLADVITASVDASHRELFINRGQEDGLAVGQFVLVNDSIIGTVSNVGACTGRVRLITDPTSRIAVKIGELDADRIMQGTGDSLAKIQLVPTKHTIKTGDIVLAQKKPGFLNTPVITGTVVQCKRNNKNPLLWDIKVKPACDIDAVKDVTVIVFRNE
ncbi:MAG: rod shape-determining protein MreC [Phycisphaerales bacterium]|nr:MAG: rod shape-determining protein MreC [Phycisphaerales bacterium]